MSDDIENDVPSSLADLAREEVDDVAEAAADALSAIQRILQRLLRSAHLTEEERQSCAGEPR